MNIKLILLLLLFTFSIAAQDYTVTALKANVREAPVQASRVVGTLKKGEAVVSSAKKGVWLYVVKGKVRGWIHASVVTEDVKYLDPNKNSIPPREKDYSSIYTNEWLLYTVTNNTQENYNPARMKRTGVIVSVWTKAKDKESGRTVDIALIQINCRDDCSRVLSITDYHADGDVKRNSDTPNAEWSAVIPDTVMEQLQLTVCAKAN